MRFDVIVDVVNFLLLFLLCLFVVVLCLGVLIEVCKVLCQLLGDMDCVLVMVFCDGVDVIVLVICCGELVVCIVVYVWSVCLGEVVDIVLFVVGGFGCGLLFLYLDVDLLVFIMCDEFVLCCVLE